MRRFLSRDVQWKQENQVIRGIFERRWTPISRLLGRNGAIKVHYDNTNAARTASNVSELGENY